MTSSTPRTMKEWMSKVIRRLDILERRLVPRAGAGTSPLSGRNLIINGNFRTNQRAYVSGASLASGIYGFDRWKSAESGTILTFVAAPQGQTVQLAGAITQIVERVNLLPGTYTLSWEGDALGAANNVGGTPAVPAESPVTFEVDGMADLAVRFTGLGGKSLGKVQLERGENATPFEWINLTEEQARCRRYFWMCAPPNAGVNYYVALGILYTAGSMYSIIDFPVPMRISPSMLAPIGTNYYGLDRSGAMDDFNQVKLGSISPQRAAVYADALVAGTAGQTGLFMTRSVAAYIGFDAEL